MADVAIDTWPFPLFPGFTVMRLPCGDISTAKLPPSIAASIERALVDNKLRFIQPLGANDSVANVTLVPDAFKGARCFHAIVSRIANNGQKSVSLYEGHVNVHAKGIFGSRANDFLITEDDAEAISALSEDADTKIANLKTFVAHPNEKAFDTSSEEKFPDFVAISRFFEGGIVHPQGSFIDKNGEGHRVLVHPVDFPLDPDEVTKYSSSFDEMMDKKTYNGLFRDDSYAMSLLPVERTLIPTTIRARVIDRRSTIKVRDDAGKIVGAASLAFGYNHLSDFLDYRLFRPSRFNPRKKDEPSFRRSFSLASRVNA